MNSERGNSPRHATLQSTNIKYTARGGTAARLQLKADVLALLLIATGEAAIAQAQQSPAPPGQGATNMDQGAGSGGLQEVVVTANKRRENIQDVPIAISAITESDLAARGVQDTLDAGAVGSTAAESVGPQPDQSGSADVHERSKQSRRVRRGDRPAATDLWTAS